MQNSDCCPIPVIDFAPFEQGDRAAQTQVAIEIDRACRELGFLYLKHHGVPQTFVNRTFEQAQAFFALPLVQKQQMAWSNEVSNRGYIGIERERLDPPQPGDLKEALNIGRESPRDRASAQPASVNLWPDEPAAFRSTLLKFFDGCAAAADQIFRAFAIALQVPDPFIVEKHQQRDYTLRLLHYPPLEAVPKPGQTRAGAHSDYGSITLLFQDDVGGLEIQRSDGTWMPAPAIPGTVLVNIGDLLQRWSNDRFRSTRHRVALPTQNQLQRDRYAVACFCQPDLDAEIVCFDSCHSSAHPPRYEPIRSGDYLRSRLQATY